jgi:hypothetical protein
MFIGYDPGEPVAFHACVESIIRHASRPVQITPVALTTMRGLYAETHTDGSNEFIYSRFLVPWLCSWAGHAIFLDGDMLLRTDIAELWDMRRYDMGVQLVKHDYQTKYPTKYLGAANEDYPRKNWSSVMLWNCGFGGNRVLRPEYVASKPGSFLHRFAWLEDERIGALPYAWNHLTMEYPPNEQAKLLHFTVGIPAFPGYEQQEGADEWRAELAAACTPMEART